MDVFMIFIKKCHNNNNNNNNNNNKEKDLKSRGSRKKMVE